MGILSVKIRIGDRDYPMKVDASEEEQLRMAGKLLNDKLKYYKDQYKIDDRQDLLAMVAFDSIAENIKLQENTSNIDSEINERINHLNSVISRSLID